jgi:hypothetical protein
MIARIHPLCIVVTAMALAVGSQLSGAETKKSPTGGGDAGREEAKTLHQADVPKLLDRLLAATAPAETRVVQDALLGACSRARENNPAWDAKMNRVLQEVAWEAVVEHPLSGLRTEP